MAESEVRRVGWTCWWPVQLVYMPVVFFAAMSISPLQVLFDQYVYHTYATMKGLDNSTQTSNQTCRGTSTWNIEVEELSALFTMYANLACYIPAFVTMPIWAAFGDVYGRRYPVIIAGVGVVISLLILIAVDVFNLPIWVTLGYSALQGLSGYFGLSVVVACAAHISHYSSPGRRTIEMAINELTYYVGGTVGDLLSGFLLNWTSFRWCFVTIAGMIVLILGYCIAVLKPGPDTDIDTVDRPTSNADRLDDASSASPEIEPVPDPDPLSINSMREPLVSVTPAHRPQKSLKSVVLQPIRLYFSPSRIRPLLWLLAAIVYLHDSAHGGSYSLLDIFAVSAPLCWWPEMLGFYRAGDMFAVGVGAVVASAVFEGKVRTEALLLAGQVSGALRGVLLGVTRTSALMYVSLVAGMLRVLCIATCRSLTSVLVPPQQHGAAIGGLASVQILANLVSGTLLSVIYANTVSVYAGIAFFVTAAAYALCMPLTGWFAYLFNKWKAHEEADARVAPVNG